MKHGKIGVPGRLAIGLLTAAAMLGGCNHGPKELPRYSLSGKVTYRGAPVAQGMISLQPDRLKGNDGPPVSMPIVDGQYKSFPGRGPTAGSYLATVTSTVWRKDVPHFKPPPEPPFAPYQLNIELPNHDSTHDFVVPVAEGQSPSGGGE